MDTQFMLGDATYNSFQLGAEKTVLINAKHQKKKRETLVLTTTKKKSVKINDFTSNIYQILQM